MKKEINKITLEKCRSTLGKGGQKYSDTELLAVRDYLYTLAEIEYTISMGIVGRVLSLDEEPINQAA